MTVQWQPFSRLLLYNHEDNCHAESTPAEEAMTREAHAFLHEHGCINTGVLTGEPQKEAPKLSDEELAWRTRQILKTADMEVPTAA